MSCTCTVIDLNISLLKVTHCTCNIIIINRLCKTANLIKTCPAGEKFTKTAERSLLVEVMSRNNNALLLSQQVTL